MTLINFLQFIGPASVAGAECKSGLIYDNDVRYYYCRTDDKEWDYCCRPDSVCGFSDGFDFPW